MLRDFAGLPQRKPGPVRGQGDADSIDPATSNWSVISPACLEALQKGGRGDRQKGTAMEHTLTSALADVRGVKLDEAAVRGHVIRPSHVQEVVSSRGLEEGIAHIESPFPASTVFPYDFDVDGFGKALHAALKDSVAGYVLQLRQHGQTIYTLQWNWAKRPWDGVKTGSPRCGCTWRAAASSSRPWR